MSLDSYQKRGSVINLGIPGRPWISKPQGSINQGSRLSFLTFFSYGNLRRIVSRILCYPV